jgi:hypothetical protein
LTIANCRYQGISDFRALHPRPLFEWHDIAWYLDIGFRRLVELPGAVAVPEIGHMAQ